MTPTAVPPYRVALINKQNDDHRVAACIHVGIRDHRIDPTEGVAAPRIEVVWFGDSNYFQNEDDVLSALPGCDYLVAVLSIETFTSDDPQIKRTITEFATWLDLHSDDPNTYIWFSRHTIEQLEGAVQTPEGKRVLQAIIGGTGAERFGYQVEPPTTPNGAVNVKFSGVASGNEIGRFTLDWIRKRYAQAKDYLWLALDNRRRHWGDAAKGVEIPVEFKREKVPAGLAGTAEFDTILDLIIDRIGSNAETRSVAGWLSLLHETARR